MSATAEFLWLQKFAGCAKGTFQRRQFCGHCEPTPQQELDPPYLMRAHLTLCNITCRMHLFVHGVSPGSAS